MLIKEAIARAKKDIGVSSDDSTIGSRYIYSILKSVRAELLRQEIEKKKGAWDNFPMQVLSKFELKAIDLAESEEFNSGTVILKSTLPFPELMDTKTGKVLSGIFLPNGQRLELTTYTAWRDSGNRRFKSEIPKVYIRDKHLVVVNYPIETSRLYVDVDGLFEDPEDVDALNDKSCVENKCVFYPDLSFYLPKYLEGRFFRIVKEDATWNLRIPKDNTNNGKDDNSSTQTQIPTSNGQDTA
jgi:hypothetical protein